jgi:thiamine biosynthesis lipoprotein
MANHRRYIYLALALLAAALFYWRSLQEPSADMVTLSGKTMGTSYSITVPARHASNRLADSIDQRLEELENIFSTWRDDSEISRFNASRSTGWFSCSEELEKVVAESIRIHDLTGGAFEVTLGPLIERWGFGKQDVTAPPSDEDMAALMLSVGTGHLETRRSPPAIRKRHPDTSLNLSGIAKGYAVDAVSGLLEQNGLAAYMVEIGGEVRTKDRNGDRPWRIAIARPQPGEPGAQRILETRKAAIATSGSYQNSLELLDKRYIHILNPATGQPVKSQTASVTVIDEESTMRADALATALMVIPAKDALRLADEQGIAAHLILLDEQGRLVSRSSMAFDPWSTTTKP